MTSGGAATRLRVPCSYQGGKQRVATEIVDRLFNVADVSDRTCFYDLCCGSGAITLELVRSLRHNTDAPIFLSEGTRLSENAWRLAFGGAKGGISGTKTQKHQEWLNMF